MKIYSQFATVPAGGLLYGKCVTLPRISNAFPADAWASILEFKIVSLSSFSDWLGDFYY